MGTLRLENVCKNYGKVEAVSQLSVECANGEFVAILGPSGAGKTSTLRMVAGLTKIDEGQLWIDDVLANTVPPYNRDISMAFERYVLYPFLTVLDNIAFPLRVAIRKAELTEQEIQHRVVEIATFLEIDPLLDRQVTKLSGGQRQRVALGRALVRRPNLYLLDEPLSHLDAKLRNRLRGELKRLFRELGRTVLYVTHDFREALSMSDKVLVLDKGECRQFGTPDEIYACPADTVVADMVGDPPIDLANCRIAQKDGKHYVQTEDFEFALSKTWSQRLRAADALPQELIAGIRPVHTRVAAKPNGGGAQIKGEVFVTEPAGSKQVLFVTVGNSRLKAVVGSAFRAGIGEPVVLDIDTDKVQLFDRSTLKSLAVAGKRNP